MCSPEKHCGQTNVSQVPVCSPENIADKRMYRKSPCVRRHRRHGVPCPCHRWYCRNDGGMGGTMAVWAKRWRYGRNDGGMGGTMAVWVERWRYGWNDGGMAEMMAVWAKRWRYGRTRHAVSLRVATQTRWRYGWARHVISLRVATLFAISRVTTLPSKPPRRVRRPLKRYNEGLKNRANAANTGVKGR